MAVWVWSAVATTLEKDKIECQDFLATSKPPFGHDQRQVVFVVGNLPVDGSNPRLRVVGAIGVRVSRQTRIPQISRHDGRSEGLQGKKSVSDTHVQRVE